MAIRHSHQNSLLEISRYIALYYPYFVVFYIGIIIIARVVPTWETYVNWTALHLSVIMAGIVTFGYWRLYSPQKFTTTWTVVRAGYTGLRTRVRKLTPTDFIKSLSVGVIFIVAATHIDFVQMSIVVFGVIAVLWVTPKSAFIARAAAISLLIAVPVALILKKPGIAEVLAIYAYDFLLIAFLVQIRKYSKMGKTVDNSLDTTGGN